MIITIVDLGTIDYMEAFQLQNRLLKLRQEDKIDDTLLLLEHFPVLTIGRSGSRSNILVSEEFLKNNGVNIYDVNRGGDITYHGPGQIVGYPIVSLNNHVRDIRVFVRNLEEVFIKLLEKEYGIKAGRNPDHTGVWVEDSKITAIGLAIKKWVTEHGFAFNVNTNLSHFDWIIPCGIVDKGVTSVEKITGDTQDIKAVKDLTAAYFCEVYNYEPKIIDKEAFLVDIGGKENE